MRNLLTEWMRRRAVGIDLHPCAVRALVLSRSVFKPHRVQIERMGMSALPEGAVNGAELANPDAVCTALTEAVFAGQRPSKQPDAPKTCAAHIAAALPQGAVVEYSASVSALAAGLALAHSSTTSLDALEPAVLTESERRLGIEAAELCADWQRAAPEQRPGQLRIVAAPRHYIDARLDALARAGLRLNTVELDCAAARRACCFAAQRQPDVQAENSLYGAVWIGHQSVQIWSLRGYSVQHEQCISRESLSHAALADALRVCAQKRPLARVLAAGELDASGAAEQMLAGLGEALRCPVSALNLAACCGAPSNTLLQPHTANDDAAFAVAFGLALRGVFA